MSSVVIHLSRTWEHAPRGDYGWQHSVPGLTIPQILGKTTCLENSFRSVLQAVYSSLIQKSDAKNPQHLSRPLDLGRFLSKHRVGQYPPGTRVSNQH